MSIIEEKEKRLAELVAIRAEKGTNPEIAREIHELQKQIWAHKTRTTTVETSLTRRLFGKPYRLLTAEERSQYRQLILPCKGSRGPWEGALTRRLFGKKLSEMSAAERKQYMQELAKKKGV